VSEGIRRIALHQPGHGGPRERGILGVEARVFGSVSEHLPVAPGTHHEDRHDQRHRTKRPARVPLDGSAWKLTIDVSMRRHGGSPCVEISLRRCRHECDTSQRNTNFWTGTCSTRHGRSSHMSGYKGWSCPRPLRVTSRGGPKTNSLCGAMSSRTSPETRISPA